MIVMGSTPATGVAGRAPASRSLPVPPFEYSTISGVFREGAKNSARGGRAPQSDSSQGPVPPCGYVEIFYFVPLVFFCGQPVLTRKRFGRTLGRISQTEAISWLSERN